MADVIRTYASVNTWIHEYKLFKLCTSDDWNKH